MAKEVFPWVPRTKLIAPQIAPHVLGRPRLQSQLQLAATTNRLTLLAAPAGAGKTTAVALLYHSAADIPIAWLTLDHGDNDPASFVTAIVAALQMVLPEVGQSAAQVLTSGASLNVPLRRIMALLINDLFEQNALLVLDDLHQIDDPAIFDGLDYLLDNLPPDVHLIATTRHEPPLALARLRSRGQLATFGMRELQFVTDETRDYLNAEWELKLSPLDLARLQQQTEGWAAGLYLLAERLQQLDEQARAAYVAHFADSNRFIFNLLAEEVLSQQPEALRRFLLQTSILEQLTPELCRAVTQDPDADVLLEQAYRQNLFLIALEEHTSHATSYRYHALFAEFLRRHLQQSDPALAAELRQRAAEQLPPERAVAHYLAAERWQQAADLLEMMGRTAIERGYIYRHIGEYIQQLPDALLNERPWLQLTLATYYAQHGHADEAEPLLIQARRLFRQQGDEQGELEALTAEALRSGGLIAPDILAQLNVKLRESAHLFRPAQRAMLHAAQQWIMQSWADSTRHIHEAIAVAQQEWEPAAVTIVASALGPELLFNDRGYADIEQFIVQALARAEEDNIVQRRFLEAGLAYIRFYQVRLKEAEQLIKPVDRFLQQIGGEAWIDGHVVWLQLTLRMVRGQYAQLQALIEAAVERLGRSAVNALFQSGVHYLAAHAAWQQGHLDAVDAVLHEWESAPSLPDAYGQPVQKLLLQGRVAAARGDFRHAEQLLQQAAEHHRPLRHTMMLHEPRLALASLYQQWERTQDIRPALAPTLSTLRARNLGGVVLQEGPPVLPLLDFAVKNNIERSFVQPLILILEQADMPRELELPGKRAPLTAREAELLQLLATGATNRAIAEQLVITERTVKAHVSNILRKMGVATRTEAVSQARAWRLLP